jgi:hypothetical protein
VNAIAPPVIRTHGDAAATALRQALSVGHAALRDAVTTYRAASAGLATGGDLLDMLRAAGSVVLAAEAITAAAKQAEATARAALATCMAETGCPAVALASHVVHLGTKAARVDIEDESAIPAELMRTPAPAPDKAAIAKMLRAGAEVPGARLVGNHEPICIFKGRTS